MGHSAANTLLALVRLQPQEPATRVTWVIRAASPGPPLRRRRCRPAAPGAGPRVRPRSAPTPSPCCPRPPSTACARGAARCGSACRPGLHHRAKCRCGSGYRAAGRARHRPSSHWFDRFSSRGGDAGSSSRRRCSSGLWRGVCWQIVGGAVGVDQPELFGRRYRARRGQVMAHRRGYRGRGDIWTLNGGTVSPLCPRTTASGNVTQPAPAGTCPSGSAEPPPEPGHLRVPVQPIRSSVCRSS